MSSIEEKRVYGAADAPTLVAVACEVGLAATAVADDRIGEFGLAHRGAVRDVAADGDRVAAATADGVLLGGVGAGPPGEALSLAPTGFGPAVAVGVADGTVLAAAPDGRVARLDAAAARATPAADDWSALGTVPTPRAVDGWLVATAGGVYDLGTGTRAGAAGEAMPGPDGPVALADADVRDVTAALPHAVTGEGCHRLGRDGAAPVALPGAVAAVDSASGAGDRPPRVVAAREGTVASLPVEGGTATDAAGEGDWTLSATGADSPLTAVATAGPERTVAATVDGTLLVDAGDGWRSRALGLPGVAGLAVVG